MAGLYIMGILVGILVALVFKGTLFKGEAVPFVMELPNYRLPGFKNVSQLLWEKAKDFLQRAFTVILVATVAVWFLQSFDTHFNMVEDSSHSILAAAAGWMAPVFAPLGLGDWRIITSLISGFMAKESVVSTLEVLFAGGVENTLTTPGGSIPSGILPALYPLCGGDCLRKARTGRKVGDSGGVLAVRDCLDRSLCSKNGGNLDGSGVI